MGDQETVTIEALRKVAENLETVKATLEAAKNSFEQAEVGGAAFSHYGLEMQIAYPITHAFMVRNLEGKVAHVETIMERLKSTASIWEQAEHHSTTKPR